jgi:SLBB domain
MAYTLAKNMKTPTHIIMAALLLFTTFLLSAGEKNVERPKDKPNVALLGGQVAVGGQVARPGELPFRPNTTIFAMLFAAGGPTQFGLLKRVKIFRDGKWFQLDLTDEKVKREEFARPNDYIEVPLKNVLGRLTTKLRG